MGGGDNELTIKTILDSTGFTKGSKQLLRAMNGLTNSIKSLFGRVVGVASIFGIISKAVSTFMSQNQQLTKQMNAAWTALGNALGPIITQIVGWVTKAVSYLVTLMKLLGFTSKTASQASKAAQGAAGSLQRTVAGFDELNKLSSGGGGGAGTLQDVDPDVFMTKLAELLKGQHWKQAADLIVQKMNELISIFHGKIVEIGTKIAPLIQGIAKILATAIRDINWKEIGTAIGDFLMAALNDLDGKDLGAILVAKLTILFGVIEGFFETENLGERLGTLLSEAVVGALDTLGNAIEKADFKKIGNNIREFFQNLDWDAVIQEIGQLLKIAWDGALDLLWGLIAGDTEEEPPLVGALRSLGDALNHLVEVVGPPLEDFYNNVLIPFADWLNETALPDIINFIADAIDTLAGILSGDVPVFEGVSEVLGEFFGMIWKWVKQFIDNVDWEQLWEDFKNAIIEGWEAVKTWWHDTFLEDGKFTIQGFLDGIIETVKNIGQWIRTNIIDPFVKGFKEGFGIASPSKVMKEMGGYIIDGLLGGLEEAWTNVSTWLGGLWDEFSTAISGIIDSAWSWGADLIGNLWDGINSQLSGFFDGIKNIAQGIRDFLGFSEPKEGPLSDFHTFGPDMMQLYAQGIEGESGKVFAAVNDVAEGVSDALTASPLAMSSVASGSVVPYGITGASSSVGGASASEGDEIRNILVEIRDLLGTMEFVAQFGDLRAVAQRITTIQKQMERARG